MSYLERAGIFDPRSAALALVSSAGALLAAEPLLLVGAPFVDCGSGAIDTNFYTKFEFSPGTAYISGAHAVLNDGGSSGATEGRVTLSSSTKTTILPHTANLYRSVIVANSTPSSDPIFRWGALDLDDMSTQWWGVAPSTSGGFYFTCNRQDMRLVCGYKDSAQSISIGPFFEAADVSTFEVDNKAHTYEILYSHSGAHFYVDGLYLGKITPSNVAFGVTRLGTAVMILTGGAGDSTPTGSTLEVWSNAIYMIGGRRRAPVWKRVSNAAPTGVIKYGPGILRKIVQGDSVGTLSLYNATATDANNAIGAFTLPRIGGALDVDVEFSTGLYYSLTGNGSATVVYE